MRGGVPEAAGRADPAQHDAVRDQGGSHHRGGRGAVLVDGEGGHGFEIEGGADGHRASVYAAPWREATAGT